MRSEEERFAEALAGGIAADLRDHPVNGLLERIVLRWFEDDDPAYFTVHALGAQDHDDLAAADAWYPLEWDTVDRELERAERILADARVAGTLEPLAAAYAEHVDIGFTDPDADSGPSVAMTEAARAVPAALDAAGVAVGPLFAVGLSHFEGWGTLASLEVTASPETVAGLEAAGLTPE